MLTAAGQSITVFRDDDPGLSGWLSGSFDGFFINRRLTELVLHRSRCPHFSGGSSVHWTTTEKICSRD